ncbi:unnamed protein product [Vitrella brassicaformis CCMP3155]|uniref:Carrier domain-containing protein n=4 Tax=Vitrella brassicaformis TaxID=1169539 RepID=A0A0G4GF20_VITBC|nr:unnamed protein product [Vitrella brassicaformis CCMP3155]|eukprot:CEM28128.1 unnamed protein product [Vitrella brassicaformis CCMP3155]
MPVLDRSLSNAGTRLSLSQEARWFVESLTHGAGLANKATLRLALPKQYTDIDRAREALSDLVDTTQCCQSSYACVGDGGERVRQKHSCVVPLVTAVDCCGWEHGKIEEEIGRLAGKAFDLQGEAPIRMIVVHSGAESVTDTVVFVGHLLSFDTPSFYAVCEKAIALLTQLESSDPEWGHQYPYFDFHFNFDEYVKAERAALANSEALKEHWSKVVSGVPPLELPMAVGASRPKGKLFEGKMATIAIDSDTVRQLWGVVRRAGVTVESLVLAAFQVAIHRYSREDEFLVAYHAHPTGPPINYPKAEKAIGPFHDTTVLRLGYSPDATLTEVAQSVLSKIAEARNHQPYPLAQIARDISKHEGKGSSSTGHSAVCQAGFVYMAFNGEMPRVANALAHTPQINAQSVDFDYTLEAYAFSDPPGKAPGVLQLNLKYNPHWLNAARAQQLLHSLAACIRGSVRSNDAEKVGDLDMVSADERRLMLDTFNDTAVDYDLSRPLHHWLEEQRNKTPDAPAVEFDGAVLTYEQLHTRADRLAKILPPKRLIGVAMDRSHEMVVALVAVLKANSAYVPIDPSYPKDRVDFLLTDCNAPVLLTQTHLLSTIVKEGGENAPRVICVDSLAETHTPGDGAMAMCECASSSSDDPAYMIYTSGSTGRPKGAINSHRGIVNRLLWMQDAYRLTERDAVLQKTPFSFDVSVWEFFWPLMVGAKIVVAKPGGHREPDYLADLIVSSGVTTCHFVPSMLSVFLDEAKAPGCSASLRRAICSGEALPLELQDRFFRTMHDVELHNLYGPTEAAIDVTAWQCSPDSKLPTVPIGKAIANTKLYILDSRLQMVPVGVAGELHIGGVQVAIGYHSRPELTAQRFISDPYSDNGGRMYKTGDLARYWPDGSIEFLGRIDFQVKIRGLRIELGEIEEAIASHPLVKEAVVLARNGALVAYLTPTHPTTQVEPSSLRSHLKETLPEYMVPSAFVQLHSLPQTPNGKLDRKALPAPSDENLGRNQSEYVAPSTGVEKAITSIWQSLLGIEKVSVDADWFENGGNSLLAMRLVSCVEKECGAKLGLAQLLKASTVRGLAALVEEKRNNAEKQSRWHKCVIEITPKQPGSTRRPLFLVHPAGGHVLCYAPIGRHMGPDFPLYGVQATGFAAGEEPNQTVEAMARLYADAITTVEPSGPYRVGGWSFGGVVAYATCLELMRRGHTVEICAVLDSWRPIILDKAKEITDQYLVGVCSRVFGGMFGQDNLVTDEELASVEGGHGAQIDYIIDKARQVGIFPADVEQSENRRILEVLVGTLRATYSYKPPRFPGTVTCFRAMEKHLHAPDPQLVWVELFAIMDADKVDVRQCAGSHYTFIVEPHVKALAHNIRDALLELEGGQK